MHRWVFEELLSLEIGFVAVGFLFSSHKMPSLFPILVTFLIYVVVPSMATNEDICLENDCFFHSMKQIHDITGKLFQKKYKFNLFEKNCFLTSWFSDHQFNIFNNLNNKNNSSVLGKYKCEFEKMDNMLKEIETILNSDALNGTNLDNLKNKVDGLSNLAKELEYLNPLEEKIKVEQVNLDLIDIKLVNLSLQLKDLLKKFDDLKGEEIDIKESHIEGALNVTRESLDRVKEAIESLKERDQNVEKIKKICLEISNLNFTLNPEASIDFDKESEILKDLTRKYYSVNKNICEKVEHTCKNRDCSETQCTLKAEEYMKEIETNLENALDDINDKEMDADKLKDELIDAENLSKKAKSKTDETKQKINQLQNTLKATELQINQTFKAFETISNVSGIIDNIKNLIEKTLKFDFNGNSDELNDLMKKINETLKGINDAEKYIKNARDWFKKAEDLLLDAKQQE